MENENIKTFSADLIQQIIKESNLETLTEMVISIERLIEKDFIDYNLTPTGITFLINTDFKEKLHLDDFRIGNTDPKDVILSIFKLIIDFITNKGELQIKEILKIADDDLTPQYNDKIIDLEKIIISNKEILSFIVFKSLSRANIIEDFEYNVDIKTINFKIENKTEFFHFTTGEIILTYYDSAKGKIKTLRLTASKTLIENLKQEVDDMYKEFEIQEDLIYQRFSKKD